MQQLVCGALSLQATGLGGSSGKAQPTLASPALAAQRRRAEVLPACRARRPRADLTIPAGASSGGSSGGGGGSGSNGSAAGPLPAPSQSPLPSRQQHAQPPQPGAQQQQQQQQKASKSGPPAPPSRARGPSTSAAGAGQAQANAGAHPRQGGMAPGLIVAAAAAPSPAGSSSGASAAAAAAPAAAKGAAPASSGAPATAADTQLIFRLERRGDGWAEEILPHLVVEQRPLERKKKRAYSRPDPWKEGSLECYLVDLGVPPPDVDRVVTQAVAWRVTPGGRSLIDRRRRSRVERNVRLVVEHLELECRVPFGPKGIAAILARCPEIMLCKPTTNDRWDRRAVELSAYLLRNGHCNVPEDWDQNPELGLWVKRQRIARAAGQLSDERLSILQSMGFAFGEVAQLTEEWEHRFDQLVDWMLWHNENQQPFSWLGVDWGARGGITARELALWTTLQKEYRARGLLPGEALARFDAIGVQWDNHLDGTPAEREWMAWFGRLLYLIERHNTLLQQPRRSQLLQGRPKMGRPRGSTSGRTVGGGNSSGGSGSGSDSDDSGPGPASGNGSSSSAGSGAELAEGGGGAARGSEDSDDEEAPLGGGGASRRGSAAVAAARLRLQEEMAARRAALAAADLRSEPGLRFWLERQRRRWRQQALPSELALMLQLAGVQLDTYSPVEWQAVAHTAAALLQGSQVTLDLAGAQRAAARRTQRVQPLQQQGQGQQRGKAAAAPPQRQEAAPPERLQPAGGSAEGVVEGARAGAGTDADASWASGEQGQAAAAAAAAGRVRREQAAATAARLPAGSVCMRAARWVQTQQALFAEGKLSPAQLRYMAFLGITWVLSEEVTHMSEGAWRQWCQRLGAAPRPLPRSGELWEWLQHQRGLHALGWLPAHRRLALEALQVRLDEFDRCPEDAEWDLRLSELLAFKAEHGHCQLLPAPGPEAAGAPSPKQQQQRWAPLAAWLAEQHRASAAGRLPAQRAAQLAAIGAAPPPRAPARVPAAGAA